MALNAERVTKRRDAGLIAGPIAAGVLIFNGALVVIDASGYLRPGRASTTDKALGRASGTYDNTDGDAGDLTVTVERGIFRYSNSADGDAIAQDDVGKNCYVAHDGAVALTSNSSARVVAGRIDGVDSEGVWVDVGNVGSDVATKFEAFLALATTAEDILVATGAGTFKRLAKGADGTVLKMVAGVVAWAADAT
jgi:hypothetical protein